MNEWIGTLKRADFGPGSWVLHGKDGKQYALHGDVPDNLQGRTVRVQGKAASGFGFTMVGQAIDVHRIEPT